MFFEKKDNILFELMYYVLIVRIVTLNFLPS